MAWLRAGSSESSAQLVLELGLEVDFVKKDVAVAVALTAAAFIVLNGLLSFTLSLSEDILVLMPWVLLMSAHCVSCEIILPVPYA
jgi:hypothetical protein